MKKMVCKMSALLCALCLVLSGCQTGVNQPETSTAENAGTEKTVTTEAGKSTEAESSKSTEVNDTATESSSAESSESETTEQSLGVSDVTVGNGTLLPGNVTGESVEGTALELGESGKARITYTENRSSVSYITSASMLPDQDELKKYDDAYFKDHALVLVTETVTSGSIKVGIESVTVDGDQAVVTLSREMSGDFGTTDMATWLIWVEVETGLDCQWTVANPALKPAGEAY